MFLINTSFWSICRTVLAQTERKVSRTPWTKFQIKMSEIDFHWWLGAVLVRFDSFIDENGWQIKHCNLQTVRYAWVHTQHLGYLCIGALAISIDSADWLIPDSKVHGANMGPIWGRQDPGGPHVGPMNFAIRDHYIGSRSYKYASFIWTNDG